LSVFRVACLFLVCTSSFEAVSASQQLGNIAETTNSALVADSLLQSLGATASQEFNDVLVQAASSVGLSSQLESYLGVGKSCARFCGKGEYASDVNASSSSKCRRGCKDCPTGTYSQGSTSQCTTCPNHFFNINTKNTGCTGCEFQYTHSPSHSACIACAAGTYTLPDRGCSSCANGWYSTTEKQSECTACPSLYGSNAAKTACEECQAGWYAVDQEGCLNCPQGYISKTARSTACETCPAGFDRDSAGQNCVECSAGMYSTAVGQGCHSCESGKFKAATGAGTCEDCPSDQKAGRGASSCSACDNDLWKPTADGGSCELTPGGIAVVIVGVFLGVLLLVGVYRWATARPNHRSKVR